MQVPHVQEGLLRLQHADQAPEDPLRREAIPVQAVPPKVSLYLGQNIQNNMKNIFFLALSGSLSRGT